MSSSPRTSPENSNITPPAPFDAKILRGNGVTDMPFKPNDRNNIRVLLGNIDFYITPIGDPNSPEFQKRRDVMMREFIDRLNAADILPADIIFAEIQSDGTLIVRAQDNKVLEMNLITSWNEALLDPSERQIRAETREREQKLQDEIAKEAFYHRSVIAEYIVGTAATAGIAGIGYSGIKAVATKLQPGQVALQSITVDIPEIGLRRITFKEPYIGSKAEMNASMRKILETHGYTIDTRGRVKSPSFDALEKTRAQLRSMNFEQYKQSEFYNEKITQQDFEKYKNEFTHSLDELSAQVKTGKVAAHTISPKMLMRSVTAHTKAFAIGMPFFFFSYNREQTGANLVTDVAEEIGFFLGYKSVSKFVPGWKGKLLGTAVGFGTVIGGNYLSDAYLEWKRHKWRFFDNSLYSDGKGALGHILNLGATEALTGLNQIAKTVWLPEFDVGIKRMNIGIPGVKRFFTMPEITFIQQKINLGTDPHLWMQQSAFQGELPGDSVRNVASWNAEVNKYRTQLSDEVHDLLGQYFRSEGIFREKSAIQKAGSKEKLFAQELTEVLQKDGTNYTFEKLTEGFVNRITTLLPTLDASKIPNNEISRAINDVTESMKIDHFYIQNRRLALGVLRGQIQSSMQELKPHITAETLAYLDTIPERMLANHEKLWSNDDEKRMYMSVIENENFITLTAGEKSERVKIGNYFAYILDDAVKWKNETYFLNQLESGNDRGFEWNHWFF